MIMYFIGNDVKNSEFDDILFDLDYKLPVKIVCGESINFDIANKISALGQPVFVKGNLWNDGKRITVENLVNNSIECVIIELRVDKSRLDNVYRTIREISSNPVLRVAKICLIEEIDDMNNILTDQKWNELLVTCYDHNLSMCWGYDANTSRYSAYLNEICGN